MKVNKRKIKNWLWDLITSGLSRDFELDVLRKFLLLNSIMFVGVFFLILLSIISFVQKNYVVSIVDIALILFLMWLFYILRKKKCYEFVGFIGTVVTGIFYLFLIGHGGIQMTAYVWILTYPIICKSQRPPGQSALSGQ